MNESSITLTVKVKRVGGKDGVVGVTYGATDGTAISTAGPSQDYVVAGNPPGTFTLSWGDQDNADKTFDVTLVNDANRESDKDFSLAITTPTGGATLGSPNAAAVTLVSDEQPRFEFSAGTYTIQETGTMVTLNVTSDAFTGPNVTVPFFTQDGTATSPVDYAGVDQATPQTLTFDGSGTSQTVNILITNDSAVEGDEYFTAHLDAPVGGGTLGATSSTTVLVVDPSAVRFKAASFSSASEGNATTITVTVERVGNLNGMISADFTISECGNPDCATESVDYTRAGGFTGTLQWNDMESADKTFSITVLGDTVIEGNENIDVSLSSGMGTPAIGGSPAKAVVADDDYRFEILDASPLSVAEGAGNATVQVRRVGSTLGAASVSFATADGTAAAGADYTDTQSPPALSWSAGEGGFKTIAIPVTDDALDESNEDFTVALSNPSNNVSGETTPLMGSPLSVEIADNDAVTVAFSAAAQGVGENVGTVTVTAARTGSTTFDITIPFTVGGTTANPADHDAADGSITILAGDTSGSTSFTVTDDAAVEGDETVIFTMGTPTGGDVAAAEPTVHTVTIADNDSSVSFAAAAQSVGENAGTVAVTATRTGATDFDMTVPYTVGGTAADPADHDAADGSITILAGDTTGSTSFSVVDDSLDEADETVTFTMGTPTGGTGTIATAAPTAHTVTITDDDAVTVAFSAAAQSVAENVGTVTVTAARSGATTFDITIPFTVGGTTANPADHDAADGSITILAGSATGTATFTVVSDALDEADETVILTMGTPTGGTVSAVAPTTHTVTVTDDDASPTVALSSSATTMAEMGGTATLTATLSAVSGRTVTVTLAFSGTATGTTDYTTSATSITINPGSTTGTVTLTSVDDNSNEPHESVIADVTAVTNGTESGTQTQTVTITDDDRGGGGGGSWSWLSLWMLLPAFLRRRRALAA